MFDCCPLAVTAYRSDHNRGLGGLGLWPEYSAMVGHPVQSQPVRDGRTGVYSRLYSSSIALVNLANVSHTVSLPAAGATIAVQHWQDPYGGAVDPKQVVLSPASGLVLLKV